MKNSISRLLLALTVVAVVAAPAFSQSSISKDSNQTPVPSGNASEAQQETITGRIIKLIPKQDDSRSVRETTEKSSICSLARI